MLIKGQINFNIKECKYNIIRTWAKLEIKFFKKTFIFKIINQIKIKIYK